MTRLHSLPVLALTLDPAAAREETASRRSFRCRQQATTRPRCLFKTYSADHVDDWAPLRRELCHNDSFNNYRQFAVNALSRLRAPLPFSHMFAAGIRLEQREGTP